MTKDQRTFILGAGFSKPAGMPLATELLPLLCNELELEEMSQWVSSVEKRIAWLTESPSTDGI